MSKNEKGSIEKPKKIAVVKKVDVDVAVVQPFEQGCTARVKAAARNEDLLQAVVVVRMLLQMHEHRAAAVDSSEQPQ